MNKKKNTGTIAAFSFASPVSIFSVKREGGLFSVK